jgi:peptidyl-prolyl cis-trans isomerase C
MPSAHASHILVESQQEAENIKQQIQEGDADFASLAEKHSKCPSGKSGGDLGNFNKGDMVPEFDQVVFSDLPIGEVSEPVKTQFGYHILQVHDRN